MSSDPLLDKMDALLNKHRGDAGAPATASSPPPADAPPPLPDDAWLPVLTDVVAMGKPVQPESGPADQEPAAAVPDAVPPPAAAIDPEALIEQIMSELEPRLNSLLRDRLVAEIRNNLDDTLSSLLAQMDVHVREIVRETLKEELGKS